MKNDIIRFENNVPDNYLVGSRDYQALLRLFTFGISSIKFDVDNIRYVNDASHINSRLLNLLKLKVGFFTKEEFKDQYIREVLKVFSLIVKKKGTRQAIYDAINLYFRACRYNGDYVVEINNKDDIQPYMIRIGVTKESNDILLLEEILKYILPTGYLYEVFKYSTAKYKSNYYTQDQLTLSVVDDYDGSNIHDNSSNIFIEKLFEGTSIGPAAICSFSDGIDAPLKSCVVNIEPVQDLHGYDYPWPRGGGVNMAHLDDRSRTGQGCTGTVSSEVISVSGTASTTYVNATYFNDINIVSGQLYTVRLSKALTVGITFRFATDTTDTTYQQVSVNAGYTSAVFTANNNFAKYRIYVSGVTSGTVINVSGLQIFVGQGTIGEFSPYSNICPISGWTQVNVNRTGVNVWDEEWETGSIDNTTGANSALGTNRIRSKNYIPVIPGETYCVYNGKGINTICYLYGADKSYIGIGNTAGLTNNYKLQVIPANVHFIRFRTENNTAATYDHDISINDPSSDHSYHAYQGTERTIPLGRTVYGGTLDVLNGKLNAKPYYASYSGQTLVGPWISSHDKYVAGATPTTGAQVVDMGAARAEYDVTPQTIKTLLGTNNIWADAGDISIEYLSETSGGSYINYYNVYNNVTDNYINVLTYPALDNVKIYNGDFTVTDIDSSVFDLDNANLFVLIHQYLKDKRIVCSSTTWTMSYDNQTNVVSAVSGGNSVSISYDNFIRNLPLLEGEDLPSEFTFTYENEIANTGSFVFNDDKKRLFTFTGYSGDKIIIEYTTDSQYLGKRIDNVVIYKNGWENESD